LISQNIKPKLIENGAPRPGPPFEGIVESFKPVSIEGPDRTTDKDPGIWLQFPVFCPMMKPEDMSTIGNDEPARAEGVRVPESPVMESTALQARKTAAVVENRISILLLSHGNGEYCRICACAISNRATRNGVLSPQAVVTEKADAFTHGPELKETEDLLRPLEFKAL